MVRGIVACCLIAVLALASPVTAGFVPDGKLLVTSQVTDSKVEILLPPGADVTEARGSLIVHRLPIINRVMADGSMTRSLPVEYTFVNQWHETFMFDGINEAVLTDGIGERHFATSVFRDGEPLLPGVTGLVPHGGMTTFTLFYDLSAGVSEVALNDVQLDLRYLNHGHPYVLSALIAGDQGEPERPNVVEVPAPPPPVPQPEIPKPVVPEPVVVKSEPVPPPAPEPIPMIPAPQPEPEPVVAYTSPVVPEVIAQPPAPAPAPEVQPLPVTCLPCAPCAPCAPCRPCFNPCELLKVPCCMLNVVCKGAQCMTCVTAKGVCDITCGTTSAVKCVLGCVCNCCTCCCNCCTCCCNCCSQCAPCGVCDPCALCNPCGSMVAAQ